MPLAQVAPDALAAHKAANGCCWIGLPLVAKTMLDVYGHLFPDEEPDRMRVLAKERRRSCGPHRVVAASPNT